MGEVIYDSIKQKDGYFTVLSHYLCTNNPKASILILHGMAEHQRRYHHFIEYLISQDYEVYIYNHRGHGTDKKLSDLGVISPENGAQIIVEDAIAVSKFVEQHKRSDKFVLFAHSMGSLIARNVIQTYDKYNAVILSGTTNPSSFITRSGLCIATVIKKFKGPKHISPYMNQLLFGGKKYTSLSSRTTYDWLSRSNPVVGAYMHDPYCGFICSASMYQDLIKITLNATKKKYIRLTRKDLPLFIISGEKDAVSNYGKEIIKFQNILKKNNFSRVETKLYPDCRHELLNELNKEEVYSDIIQWLKKNL
jgi:alpha-beta hydrolase superfamily lysophospholipase